MKVEDLIKILEEADPESEVLVIDDQGSENKENWCEYPQCMYDYYTKENPVEKKFELHMYR